MKKEKHANLSQNLQLWEFSKELKNAFETAVINEPSVLEPLNFHCILNLGIHALSIYFKLKTQLSPIFALGGKRHLSVNLVLAHALTVKLSLTLKAPNKNWSRRHFIFFLLLSFEENKG